MKCMLVQMNPAVGALEKNADAILKDAQAAAAAGADIVVFPEWALCGAPAAGLLDRADFMKAVEAAAERLVNALPPDVLVIFGLPDLLDGRPCSAATLIYRGECVGTAKADDELFIYKHDGLRLGIYLGSDRRGSLAVAAAGMKDDCDVWVYLAASPFQQAPGAHRRERAAQAAKAIGRPLLLTNLVGGQDEWVFDGGALAVRADGSLAANAARFTEGILDVELTEHPGNPWQVESGVAAPTLGQLEEIYTALKLGIRDYVKKNGFPGALVSLSGGIDSALVAALAVDALGHKRVLGMTLPSKITSSETLTDALELARWLKISCPQLPIAPAVDTLTAALNMGWSGLQELDKRDPGTLVEENLQARIRGVMAMAFSNRYGHLLLATGNKSERLTGYGTLYGDMCGGFAPLAHVPKTMVFALSHWRNKQGEVIPPRIIDRPPSAELRPDQKDTDSLPPYEVLDVILERYVEQRHSLKEIVADGYDDETVRRVMHLVDASEYKRRQAAPGILISPMDYIPLHRMPMTHAFRG